MDEKMDDRDEDIIYHVLFATRISMPMEITCPVLLIMKKVN
jgi:hypothetical protein